MKTDTPETDKHRSRLRTVAESAEFEEKLERERDNAISRLAQASQEREHNAYQALMWQGIAERLANLIKRMNFGDTFPAITSALAAFEEAKK